MEKSFMEGASMLPRIPSLPGAHKVSFLHMVISIDYDETWSADPPLWAEFALNAQDAGHIVILTTNRPNAEGFREEVYEDCAEYVTAVIFAGTLPKQTAARYFGYDVDVWIDDLPHTVTEGRSF